MQTKVQSLLFLLLRLSALPCSCCSSAEQGQLEYIPCSSLAQPRHSPGPLIKHKPSSFLDLSLSHSRCSVTSLHLPPFNLFPSIHPSFLLLNLLPGPSSLVLVAYLSRQRFDIHIGTVFRVNLYKAANLLFSSAGVKHAPCDLGPCSL